MYKEDEKTEKLKGINEPMSDKAAARTFLALILISISVAFVGEIRLTGWTRARIWPITSPYLLPNFLMILAYVNIFLFIVTVMHIIFSKDEK